MLIAFLISLTILVLSLFGLKSHNATISGLSENGLILAVFGFLAIGILFIAGNK